VKKVLKLTVADPRADGTKRALPGKEAEKGDCFVFRLHERRGKGKVSTSVEKVPNHTDQRESQRKPSGVNEEKKTEGGTIESREKKRQWTKKKEF